MKGLIVDVVDSCIAEKLGKYMQMDTEILPTAERLAEIIPDYDVLIMRVDPPIKKEILDAAKRLKVIGVCSVGLNHVDLEYAKQKGVEVMNSPGLNIDSVAELTVGRMIDMARHVVRAHNDTLKKKNWDKYPYMGQELNGKTVGIIGFGKIGRRVAELCKAFRMTTLAYDPYVSVEDGKKVDVEILPLEDLIRRSNFITIHVPLTPETKNMISREQIAMMPDGAIIINMGRGGLVDEEAVYQALKSGKLGGMGTDVMALELGASFSPDAKLESPLYELDNFVVTPHIGGQTVDSQKRIGESISERIISLLKLK